MRYVHLLLQRRLRIVGQMLALQLGSVLVMLGLEALHIGHLRLHAGDAAGYGLTFGIILGIGLFVELARLTEQEWPASFWRLSPLPDARRFVFTQLATLVAAVVFIAVDAVVLVPLAHFGGAGISTNIVLTWPVAVAFIAMALSTLVWGWCFISLVHLASLALATYLPVNREKFWRGVLYAVMTIGLGFTVGKIGDALSRVIGPTISAGFSLAFGKTGNVINFAGHMAALWLVVLYFWLLIALMGGLGAWLLAHRVETTQPLQ